MKHLKHNGMKKILLMVALAATLTTGMAQEVSSRAKAMRIMKFARPEYQVKDVKVLVDTMTVYALNEQVVYPFGKWNSIEQYITNGQIRWDREVGYKNFLDSMHVSVNSLKRLDGSEIDVFRSISTGLMEILAAHITDPEVAFVNGLHPGMTKEDVFNVFFDTYPASYTQDITVLKVVSGANEIEQVYTFKGRRLRSIDVRSRYKYY